MHRAGRRTDWRQPSRVGALRALSVESLEPRRMLNAAPIVSLDFEQDQSLTQLQADGWQVDAQTLDDQDGIDDLRAIDGVLTLTDDDNLTDHRWTHSATYGFGALPEGQLRVSAGTGGSYTGNPSHTISVQAAGSAIATIVIRNNLDGTLQSGGQTIVFADTNWKNQFRDYVIDWTVDANGLNGLVSLSFESSDGVVTKLVQQPFIANGVPDGIKIGAGWSSPVDTQLRIDALEVVPGPFTSEIAPSTYYDVAIGASAGDVVSGHINLQSSPFDVTPVFEIVGGTGNGLFEIDTITDTHARSFGQIVVAPGVTLSSLGAYTLDVRLNNGVTTSAVDTITIEVVGQTIASQIFDAVRGRTRYRVADITDATVADWLSKIQPDGSFSDLSGNHWTESASRLGSLSEAYVYNGAYQGDAALRSKLYDAVVYWADNVTGDGGSFVNPAWAWPRQIAAVGYFLDADIEAEKRSTDPVISARAWEVFDAVIDGSESGVTHRRDSEEHYWGGNLGYRLEGMQTRAVVMNDYNRPLTFAGGFQRGFVPTASFADIHFLMTQSFEPSSGPFSVGLTLDGGFSQHTGGAAQLYSLGYGRDWASDVTAASANMSGSSWALSQTEYDQLADYYLDGMQWQIYEGQGDYFSQGRRLSKTRTGAYSNGDTVLVSLLNGLINTAGAGQLTRYAELVATRDAWASPAGQDLVGNKAFSNHDYMLHRTESYYVSTKMNSTRSSGNETGNASNLNHYLIGDGTTLIMRTGDEYLNARVGWDWHQLPGVTAESRTDALPLRNWNANQQGLNEFAGVASDGQYGLAAFINDRYDPSDSLYQYHTVNSNKGTFFFDGGFIALGAGINRVAAGQNQAVRTTINQVEWKGDLSYDIGAGVQTIPPGNHSTNSFTLSTPGWFHQDGVGYVIIPGAGQNVTAYLDLRLTNNDWYDIDHANAQGDTQAVEMFQLAIDHGNNPNDEQYSYLVLPDIDVSQMPAYVAQWELEIVANTPAVQAVRDVGNSVTEIVFYEPGMITIADGWTITSDEPALVLLAESDGNLDVTVSDPMHSMTLDHVTISISQELQGPGSVWDSSTGTSTLTIGLSNEVLLAGQSVTTHFDRSDFGDAPAPYSTTLASNGARHVSAGPRLGNSRDIESDGQPTAAANGDDVSGNDEDGVEFGGIDATASMAAVNIFLENASSAKVDAWIDFNGDGDWSDAGEKILDSVTVNNAMQTLNYNLPSSVTPGDTFARVRISTDGNLGPTGPAVDGEVEDYLLTVASSPPTVESIVINNGDQQRSSLESVRVTFDRVVDIDNSGGDPFRFSNVGTNDVVTSTGVVTEANGKTVVDFSFAAGASVNNSGGLVDGSYQLIVNASLVTAIGVALDGNADGAAGGDRVFGDVAADNFFRKYGDGDGNRMVDLSDFDAFRQTYAKSLGDFGYDSRFDTDSDERITLLDFAHFRKNFGS